ncbi:nuclease [Alicyclobacillus acidoterrestris]|nr:nuclease [Alicyclobacillus acidoterrestris]
MSTQEHAERAHALLGASKAAQWINCPPSARLQEGIPDRRSEFADEGTVAHELAEVKLRSLLINANPDAQLALEGRLETIKASKFYGVEMENVVQEYVDFVEERFTAAKARASDAVIILEEWLDFSEWTAPDQGGIGDVVIVSDGVMDVIDLKYGKGVPVSAIGNPQIRLYGLGAWANYNYLYQISEVHMTIAQPRARGITTEVMPIDDLLEWAETVVKPAAALAYAGEGEFKPGDHCRWCKVKATCRARADENMKALAYEFRDPALMSDEEIGSILFVAEQLRAWAKDVQDYAFEQAKSGRRVPQWKLVEGRSNRVITDKAAARAAMEAAGLAQDKFLKPQELFGIGDLEKHIGKKELNALIGDFIEKPPGKPVLVPETDKRPELNSVDQDFENEDFGGMLDG